MLNALTKRKKVDEGFSFIELVIVVAVIGILTAIAIPSYGGIQTAAKQAAVTSTAENGMKLIAARDASGGQGGTPSEELDGLTNDTLGAVLFDADGRAVTGSASGDCVWAYNKKELNTNNTPKYQASKGDCSKLNTDNLTIDGNGNLVNPGTGNPGAGNPGTGNPGTGAPGENPGDSTAASAIFKLQCPVDVPWTSAFADFTGTQKWSDNVELANNTPRDLQANVAYEVEFVGNYTTTKALSGETLQEIANTNACMKSVDSWGATSGVKSLQNALLFANSVEYVAPLPSSVEDVARMFAYADAFNQDISGWDVSNVTNMDRMFFGARTFNQDISGWNVGNVTNMKLMFDNAWAFDQNLNNWNVSNVTNMDGMFSGTQNFNSPLNKWDVSKVTVMDYMFQSTPAFDQDLSGWDVSSVQSSEGFANASKLAESPGKLPKF